MPKPSTSKKDVVLKIGLNRPTSEIVAAAAKQGVSVSKAYIHLLRTPPSKGPAKATARTQPSKKSAPLGKAVVARVVLAPTADKSPGDSKTPVSKSDFIRSMPNATPAAIFVAAKKAGLSFSRALIHIVRSKTSEPTKTVARPAEAKSKAPPASAGTSSSPRNKSDLIRSMPTATVDQILQAGKKLGMKFTAGYIATVRYNARVATPKSAAAKPVGKAKPVKTANTKPQTAAGFIREQGTLSHAAVASAAKAAGFAITADYVRRMRRRDKKAGRATTAAPREVAAAPKATAVIPATKSGSVSLSAAAGKLGAGDGTRTAAERTFVRAALPLTIDRAMELVRALAALVG